MPLAATLVAPRCSCNCLKQLWQEGFLRAVLPLLGIVSNSEAVTLPRWNYCPIQSSQNRTLEPWRACAGLCGSGKVKVKPPEHLQCTLQAPALRFLLQGCLRFTACTGYLWKALCTTHPITNLFPLQEGALGLCQFAEHFT